MRMIDSQARFIPRTEWFSAGTEARRGFFSPDLHRHEGYELVAIDSGSAILQIEQRSYRLERDDCAFIAEGEYHCLHVPGRCRCTYLDFRPARLFSGRELLEAFLRPFLNGLRGGTHARPRQRGIAEAARALARLAGQRPRDPIAIAARILDLVRAWSRLKCARPRQSIADRERIAPALALIYDRFDARLSVQTMAEACAMSRASFKRAFGRATGTSPKAFLDEHKLLQAVGLLSATDRKIADIAASAGFASLTNFNRRFLKRFGVAPSRYREG